MLSYIVTHNMTYTVLNAFSWNAPLNVQGRTAEGNGSQTKPMLAAMLAKSGHMQKFGHPRANYLDFEV